MLDDEFVNQEIQEPVVVIRNNDIKKVDYQIVQSNNLVDALYTLSANELKIIFMVETIVLKKLNLQMENQLVIAKW